MLEFPSGLIDAGETLEAAALRELREETGFLGRITRVAFPRLLSAPWLSSESFAMVWAEIDADAPHPGVEHEAEEVIEPIAVLWDDELESRIAALAAARGWDVEGKVATLASAWTAARAAC